MVTTSPTFWWGGRATWSHGEHSLERLVGVGEPRRVYGRCRYPDRTALTRGATALDRLRCHRQGDASCWVWAGRPGRPARQTGTPELRLPRRVSAAVLAFRQGRRPKKKLYAWPL